MGQKPPPVAVTFLPGWEELNRRLRKTLLEMAASVPDKVTNRKSGAPYFRNKWLSHSRLHLDGPPVFADLAAAIETASTAMLRGGAQTTPLRVGNLWSIVSRAEMEGRPHNHAGRVSVAYYVDAGTAGPEDGGLLLFFEDTKQHAPTHAVAPQPGLLVIFPSRLYHAVSRYRGSLPRIVISANLF